jgi:broad-specificity NMP kinase
MMKLFKIGDVQKAGCEKCKAFVDATFVLRDVPLSDGSCIVENVLVGVCNQCDSVTVLPQQESELVKSVIDKARLNKV